MRSSRCSRTASGFGSTTAGRVIEPGGWDALRPLHQSGAIRTYIHDPMSVAPTWHSARVIAELFGVWRQVPLTVAPRVAAHPDRPPRSELRTANSPAQEDRQGTAYSDMLLMVQAVMVRCEDRGPIVGDYGIHVDEPEMTVRERARDPCGGANLGEPLRAVNAERPP